ncbi:MAG: LysM peptidoglycan-binding domain-containing protein [Rhodobacteraceae bacterium]|nr:LysM peptidoglycan-binding domain-containing protein [Paracoccaceae bacterium]
MLKFMPKETLAQWAVGSVAVVGAASVAYVVIFPSAPPEPELKAPSAISMTEPQPGADPAADIAPELRLAMAGPASDAAPRFDLVRVTDLGDVLIAGQAPARSTVAALIEEKQVARTISSDAGEFVMMFEIAPSPAPRVLELEVQLASGQRVRSLDTLMLAPRSPVLAGQIAPDGQTQPVQSLREVQTDPLFPGTASAPSRPQLDAHSMVSAEGIAAGSDPKADEDLAQAAATPRPELDPQPAPMAVLMRADGTVQVLGEAPGLPQTGGAGNVIIDSVVYDDEGEVALGGRAAGAGHELQIYLDNQPILRTRAGAAGDWQAQLAGIERGVYRLRIDELDEAQQVVSRAEIPFERVTPEIARESAGPQALIVQPGNTLWGMSVDRYGDGMRYMRIFDANRDQIRNPDLIYPGQVFVLPESDG